MRRNTSDDDPQDYIPFPEKEENEAIRQAFIVVNDQKKIEGKKINLPAPLSDDLHTIEEKTVDELDPKYTNRLHEIKEEIYRIYN